LFESLISLTSTRSSRYMQLLMTGGEHIHTPVMWKQ
jgi:hypothetical protein